VTVTSKREKHARAKVERVKRSVGKRRKLFRDAKLEIEHMGKRNVVIRGKGGKGTREGNHDVRRGEETKSRKEVSAALLGKGGSNR